MTQDEIKCFRCNAKRATHWGNHLCEECLRIILHQDKYGTERDER